jgi:ABC-type oligopeptide transport system substrate-binding subunit
LFVASFFGSRLVLCHLDQLYKTISRGTTCKISNSYRGTVLDPDNWLYEYFASAGSKRSLYSNPEFDRLPQQQQQNFDPDQRELVLQKAMRLLLEDAP